MSNDTVAKTEIKVIVFQLKDEEYALEVDYIQSIERMQPVTRIPKTDSFVTGVINLRGVITPIINLRKRFGIEEKEYDEATRILVISNDQLELGFIVDGANDVIDIPVEKIERSPEVIGGVETDYIRGVVKLDKRLFTLLNLEKVVQMN